MSWDDLKKNAEDELEALRESDEILNDEYYQKVREIKSRIRHYRDIKEKSRFSVVK